LPVISGRHFSNGDAAVGAGLIVAFIAVFLPWYSASTNCNGVAGCGGFNFSVSAGGLSYWSGWLFFLAVLVGLALFVLRTFVRQVALPTLPQPDAILYTVIGVFMAVMAILWLLLGSGAGAVSGPGYSAGASFGLFVGLVAAIIVAVGGVLKRADPQIVATGHPTPGAGSPYGGSPPPPPPV
jgi:hypothetical protein